MRIFVKKLQASSLEKIKNTQEGGFLFVKLRPAAINRQKVAEIERLLFIEKILMG